MAGTDKFSDDFVASLLARDAKDSAIKYSTIGTDAFLSSKAPLNKPKPNTRFLRNIIKETDSHNAALLAKEAAESKARLQNLAKKDISVPPADIRRRQLGHIAAHLTNRPKKRQGKNDDKEAVTNKRKRRRNSASDGEEDIRGKKSRGERDERRQGEDDQAVVESREEKGSRHRSHRRHRSRSNERPADDTPKASSRRRSPSSRGHGSGSSRREIAASDRQLMTKSSRFDKDEEGRKRHGSYRQHHLPSSSDTSPKSQPYKARQSSKIKPSAPVQDDSDSDPLSSLIGPRPPPAIRSRGRGTPNNSTMNGIDFRFSSTYDPSADIQPEANDLGPDDDWDQALEALRDRTKWKQQGADRLRAAGFTEEEVKKWEGSGTGRKGSDGGDGDVEAVKWQKKGEAREWDRGKVVGIGGVWESTGVGAGDVNFGRLKGS